LTKAVFLQKTLQQKQLIRYLTVKSKRNIIFAGMRSTKSIFIFILLFLSVTHLFAQSNNATLFGKVTDQNGKPLEQANISLKNTTIGTVSNRDGAYLLRIPAKKQVIIVYSTVGYTPVEKTITAGEEQKIEMKVTLQQTDQKIDEVQVVQHQRKQNQPRPY